MSDSHKKRARSVDTEIGFGESQGVRPAAKVLRKGRERGNNMKVKKLKGSAPESSARQTLFRSGNDHIVAKTQRGGEGKIIRGHMPAQHVVELPGQVYDETIAPLIAKALGHRGEGGERAVETREEAPNSVQAPTLGLAGGIASRDSETSRLQLAIHTAQRMVEDRDGAIRNLLNGIEIRGKTIQILDGVVQNSTHRLKLLRDDLQIARAMLDGATADYREAADGRADYMARYLKEQATSSELETRLADQESCNKALQYAIHDVAQDLITAQDEKAACVKENNGLKAKIFEADLTSSFCKDEYEQARRALQTENIGLKGTIAGKERELQTITDEKEMMRKQIAELKGRVTAAEMYQQWSTS
ncbi:hypothetical protein LTR15_003085 [Elasticomyces elasticus]|nr:hypothetical protein LTR15_003085 [Elasticomyces elasticus]